MKPGTILIVALLGLAMTSCKSKLAMNYNNMIVKKQQSLAANMDEEEPGLKNYFANYVYDSIVCVATRMEARIDSIIRDITKTAPPKVKEGDHFKQAALVYFEYMKSVYTAYKDYGLQTTPQGRQFQLQVMSMVTSKEGNAIASMQQAQRIFAKDNGFKIQAEKKSQNKSFTASPAGQ